MQPTRKIKLTFARQTLRALDHDDLGKVAGARSAETGVDGPCTIGSVRVCTRTSVQGGGNCGTF